ncbi:MAG: hypothetical protein QOE90_1509 [Thermoplasmata archaeon]|jgi:hypothetical protein|nr:hypothetical protein [Thermoplasmata archaeon]
MKIQLTCILIATLLTLTLVPTSLAATAPQGTVVAQGHATVERTNGVPGKTTAETIGTLKNLPGKDVPCDWQDAQQTDWGCLVEYVTTVEIDGVVDCADVTTSVTDEVFGCNPVVIPVTLTSPARDVLYQDIPSTGKTTSEIAQACNDYHGLDPRCAPYNIVVNLPGYGANTAAFNFANPIPSLLNAVSLGDATTSASEAATVLTSSDPFVVAAGPITLP